MKLEGATYMDIHKIGGGIGFTVRHVHQTYLEIPLLIVGRRTTSWSSSFPV